MCNILSINKSTKSKVNEMGDIVAIYDHEPTATERKLFDITKVEKIKAKEIIENIEKGTDSEKEYPKYKGNIKNLTSKDKETISNKRNRVSEMRKIIKKIKTKKPLNTKKQTTYPDKFKQLREG